MDNLLAVARTLSQMGWHNFYLKILKLISLAEARRRKRGIEKGECLKVEEFGKTMGFVIGFQEGGFFVGLTCGLELIA